MQHRSTSLCVAVLVTIVGTAAAVSVHASRFTLAPEHPTPPQWHRVDRHSGAEHTFDVLVGLNRQNKDKMDAHFWAASTPGSPSYGDHLGHEQMRQMISPGKATVDRVKAWLSRAGIPAKHIITSPHEDSMRVTGVMEAQLTHLFGAEFATYEHSSSKRLARRATGPILLPSDFRGVIDVVAGYRGFPLDSVKPKEKSTTEGFPAAPYVDPKVIFDAYNVSLSDLPTPNPKNIQSMFQGTGQFISGKDLTDFCEKHLNFSQFDQLKCKITKYIGENNGQQPGMESELDSQYITATGFGTETWVWSFPSDDFCADLLGWAQQVFEHDSGAFPYVISMSYGAQGLPTYCDKGVIARLTEDTQKMGTMGISVLIASGDMGSGELSREGYSGGLLHGSFPSDTPYVTAVGATTFVNSGSSGKQMASSSFGSGGGFAYHTARPSYQASAVSTFFDRAGSQLPPALSYNAEGRGTPDVSALGEGYQVLLNGVTKSVSGTSCATPAFAGLISQLNNVRLAKGKTLGFLNPLLYANPGVFTDITVGSNDIHQDGMGWYAAEGWDPATGLGTPNFAKLLDLVRNL